MNGNQFEQLPYFILCHLTPRCHRRGIEGLEINERICGEISTFHCPHAERLEGVSIVVTGLSGKFFAEHLAESFFHSRKTPIQVAYSLEGKLTSPPVEMGLQHSPMTNGPPFLPSAPLRGASFQVLLKSTLKY